MKILRPLALLAGMLLPCAALPALRAANPSVLRTVYLAGDDWPPFLSATLPGNGMAGTIAGTVYRKMGVALEIDYYPWKRAMQLGLSNPRYSGLLTVWRTPEREKLCHFSVPIARTVTVLAYLKTVPLSAGTLADLGRIPIGTVAGYAYGEQFDTLAAQGELRVEEAVSDYVNVRKLLLHRFPAILIEKQVLRHLMKSKSFSAAERAQIGIDERFFKERSAHICFQRTAAGLAQQQTFNETARRVDMTRIERDYWKRIGEVRVKTGK